MIDQLTIDKIRDTSQIVDVVSEFVSLRRRGLNYVGLCPFHSDKNPSFYVSPSKNICKCFSCGEGGDPVHFIMKHEQVGYMEAIRWLAKKYNIEIQEKELTDAEKAAQNDREGMLKLNEFVMKTFEEDLYENPEGKAVGLTYFRERGLQDETIKRFHLGYAVENKQDLATRAMKAGHKRDYLLTPEDASKLGVGLCYADNPQQTPICRFSGRVIFPFMSLSGKPVAFGGRILQRVDHAFKKYVNSPESMIYHKGNMLYGIFQAKKEIAKQNKCYIVEGNVDVISMSQAGFENVVASAGTALTSSQIHMIQRFTNNVTLMFDGDEAGIRATLKTIDLLLLEGMNVKLLLFPDGDDPDSFCRKHTTEELKAFFDNNEQDFISYKTQMLLRDAGNDPQRRSSVLQNIAQSIALIDEPLMADLYERNLAQTFQISEMAVKEVIKEQRKTNYAAELRRMEIEQRREEARAEQAANGQVASEETTPDATPAAAAPAPQPARPVQTSATIAAITQSFARPTDVHELNIIRYIVRYGGEYFPFRWTDEEGNPQEESWRVVDFIGSDLANDGISFQNPLYAQILNMAFEASADPNAEFNSIRYFTCNEDPVISKLALDLTADQNETVVSNEENLSVAVPRVMMELKECLVLMEIDELNKKLREPNCDVIAIMDRLRECNAIKIELGKLLGERVVRRQ